MISDEFTDQYPDCNRSEASSGCPHGCGIHCQQNMARQRAHGERLAERMKNLSDDDWQWLAGTGNYAQ